MASLVRLTGESRELQAASPYADADFPTLGISECYSTFYYSFNRTLPPAILPTSAWLEGSTHPGNYLVLPYLDIRLLM
jgi:hypothetical protein